MGSAVIYATYIKNDKGLKIAKEILDTIQTNMSDAHIIVGVNPTKHKAHDEWLKFLESNDVEYEITPDELVIITDASAYQSALRLFNRVRRDEYDAVWFMHTKGGAKQEHKRLHQREKFCKLLFVNNEPLMELLQIPSVGIVGHSLSMCALRSSGTTGTKTMKEINEKLDKYLTGASFYRYNLHTMFGCSWTALNSFLNAVHSSFFNTNLIRGGFFEVLFTALVSRAGYAPLSLDFGIRLGRNNDYKKVKLHQLYIDELKLWAEESHVDISHILKHMEKSK